MADHLLSVSILFFVLTLFVHLSTSLNNSVFSTTPKTQNLMIMFCFLVIVIKAISVNVMIRFHLDAIRLDELRKSLFISSICTVYSVSLIVGSLYQRNTNGAVLIHERGFVYATSAVVFMLIQIAVILVAISRV